MDERLAARASAQGGYFNRSEALDCGYDDHQIAAAIRAGEWCRVRTGVYAPADTYAALDANGRHLVGARSVVDKLGATVALSHSTACAEHGFAQFDADFDNVQLTRLDGHSGRREAGVVHHEGRMPEGDVEERAGRLVVVPRRCVWEASTITTQRGAVVVMDSALNGEAIEPEDLPAAAVAYRSWQGSRSAGIAARLADGGAESPGESLTRFMCYEQHLPRPTLQHLVSDEQGVVARTDFAWLEYSHVGEFDGQIKYARGLGPEHGASEVVIEEKRREDLVRRQGLGMSRLIWREVLPRRTRFTAAWLWRDLMQSRALYLRNRTSIAV